MSGVAGQKHTLVPVTFSDGLVMVPMRDFQQLESERTPHRLEECRLRIDVAGRDVRVEEIVLIVPEVPAIDRRADAETVGIEQKIQRAPPQRVRLEEFRRAEEKADVRTHRSAPEILDAQ